MIPDGPSTSDPPPIPAAPVPARAGVSEIGSWLLGSLFGGLLAFGFVTNGGDDHPRAMWFSYGVQLCAPGILAFVAWRARRPALYLGAAVIGMAMLFTTMSVVALPFYIPAGMSVVAYGRRAGETEGKLSDPAIVMLTLFLVMAAFGSLFLHPDPGCRTGPNFSDCSSDMVTPVEGTVSLVFSFASIVVPILLSAPRKKLRLSRSRP